MVALTRQIGPTLRRNRTIVRGWSSVVGTPTRRRTTYLPQSACNAEPTPIPVGTSRDLANVAAFVASKDVSTLTRNDPSTMPGHARGPSTRSPANAIPDGGQIAVA